MAAETRTCPHCGTGLAPDAAGGLCPRCLIALNLSIPTESDGTGVESAEAGRPAGASPNPPSLAELARYFPQLELLELLGRGGMGAVYKARQPRLDRLVALKILPPGVRADAAFAERFTREAQALAKLSHPNIVTLYEFGQTDGLFYFLMEFVDGITLRRLLSTGRLPPKEALAIVPQICDALQYAHQRGIVHRDIKPENLLLSKEGQVKITDFGVARILAQGQDQPVAEGAWLDPGSVLTQARTVVGTPQYMAPEQLERPLEVDHRADIYSLGVVFYQMLTGELPTGKFEVPSKKIMLDVRLDEVVLRALEKQPECRYQQVSELRTMIETIAPTLRIVDDVGARPSATGSSTTRTTSPRRVLKSSVAIVATAVLIIAVIVAVFLLKHPTRDHDSSATISRDLDAKVVQLARPDTSVARVIQLLGEPQDYFWGSQSFRKDKLPETYIMKYGGGLRLVISGGNLIELRSEEPGPGFTWRRKLRMGSSLQEVLRVVGRPAKTVIGQPLTFDPNVLYQDIGGKNGYCYYSRPDQQVRFFFRDYKVVALYITLTGDHLPTPE